MKPMTLNLSRMKKIAGNKKSSTFEHELGHVIVIAHGSLPASMRKEIEKLPLAEGGDVLPKYMHPPKDPKMVAVPRLAMAEGGMPEGQGPCKNPNCKSYGKVHPNCRCYGGFAKGGVVQSACDSKSYHHPSCELYSEGGKVDKLELDTVRPDSGFGSVTVKDAEGGVVKAPGDWMSAGSDPANQPPQGVQTDVITKDRKNDADEKENDGGMTHKDVEEGTKHLKAGERVKMYADPQEPVSADDSAPVVAAPPAIDPQVAAPIPEQQPAVAPPPPANPAAAMAAQNPMQGVDVPAVPKEQPNLNPNGTLNPAAITSNAQNASDVERDAAVAAGKAHANMQAGYLQQTAENSQRLQQNYQQIAGHVQDFDKWMAGNTINPNHYVESMGTARKVSTALGLFLGGLGQINGGSNPALDYLNRQIDRDIDAQKSRVDQAKTIYGAYRDLYGDGQTTYNATKASLLDILAHQSDQVAAQLATPLAQANNMKLKSAIAIDKNKALRDAAISSNDLPGRSKAPGSPQGAPGGRGPVGSARPGSDKSMAPDDPKWGDSDLKVGSKEAPKTNDAPQIKVNFDKLKQDQFMGAKGVPGYITPAEVGEATQAVDRVNTINQVLREVHKQFPEMWKHGYHADALSTGLDDAHVLGVQVPNPGAAFPGMKEYFTASSAIKKQLGNAIKGGLSPEVSELIQKQLVNTHDTPAQYRSKLETIDNLLRQAANASVLKKYNLATGLPE